MSAARSRVASWRPSLEPKRPTSPLLLIRSRLARPPIVSPSRPTTEASSAAAVSVSARALATCVAERRGTPGILYRTIVLYIFRTSVLFRVVKERSDADQMAWLGGGRD